MLRNKLEPKKKDDKSTKAKKSLTKKRKRTATKPKADTESEEESSKREIRYRKTKKKKRQSDFISKKDRPDQLKSDRKLNQLGLKGQGGESGWEEQGGPVW